MAQEKKEKKQTTQKKKSSTDLKRTVDETSVNVAGIATEVIAHGQKLDELERIIDRLRKRLGV